MTDQRQGMFPVLQNSHWALTVTSQLLHVKKTNPSWTDIPLLDLILPFCSRQTGSILGKASTCSCFITFLLGCLQNVVLITLNKDWSFTLLSKHPNINDQFMTAWFSSVFFHCSWISYQKLQLQPTEVFVESDIIKYHIISKWYHKMSICRLYRMRETLLSTSYL